MNAEDFVEYLIVGMAVMLAALVGLLLGALLTTAPGSIVLFLGVMLTTPLVGYTLVKLGVRL